MMQYDFIEGVPELESIGDFETKENMHTYQTYQAENSFFKPTISNSNMTTADDIWQTSSFNSNTMNQPFYFNSLSHPNQYQTMDNINYDYQTLPNGSYLIDSYPHMLTNHYPIDPYSTQTTYNSTSMDYSSPSTYISTADSSSYLPSMYPITTVVVPPDYQSSTSYWDSSMMKMTTHDVTSASNSSNSSTSARKLPCLVCHEESSGYHFGAYTCESCKAFYRRVTKDPQIEIKHSCEYPLPHINKSNRKDCRACRKAKCEQVGMTAMPKDRPSRTTTTTATAEKVTYETSSISMTELLEQLSHDLLYDQLFTSTALENLLRILDLPSIVPAHLDCYTLYMSALRIWRNQYNHSWQIVANAAVMDTFAVLLFLFHAFVTMTENDEDKSLNNSKFDKLVSILQQEIDRITGADQRSACRIKASFMKCYVALAQHSNSTANQFDNNNVPQTPFISYPQCSLYGQ